MTRSESESSRGTSGICCNYLGVPGVSIDDARGRESHRNLKSGGGVLGVGTEDAVYGDAIAPICATSADVG